MINKDTPASICFVCGAPTIHLSMPSPSPAVLLTNPLLLPVFILVAIFATCLRVLAILPGQRGKPPKRTRGTPTRLLIVLGSGGHTAEMLALLRNLDPHSYTHRTYVVSSGDAFSAGKAREFEQALRSQEMEKDPSPTAEQSLRNLRKGDTRVDLDQQSSYEIVTVPRARRVHQSLFTTPFSAIKCLISCLSVLRHVNTPQSPDSPLARYPDLILTNGPGTAVIVILASLILRFFNVDGANSPRKMRTIYIESWARVRRLSLSGQLLLPVVDRFIVQWEQLRNLTEKGEYLGVLL